MDDPAQQNRPKRLFINDVDKYSSGNIAKFLAACCVKDNSEDADEDEDESPSSSRGEPAFEVVGTLSGPTKERLESFMLEYYTSPTREELFEHMMECDVVVYNISETTDQEEIDEATWAFSALDAEMDNFKSKKTFILISTLMTWAMTRPQDPDQLDLIFREEDFRRRRPHPRFKYHNELEKLVLKLVKVKKAKLVGYVVASGLQYGVGENLFHFFFKVSWLIQFPRVPLFGEGTNYLPMIHVHDLAGVIQKIIELKPKSKYIVAVDDAKNTLEEVVKEVSHILGPGKINKLQENKAITMNAFEPDDLIFLRINFCVDAFTIKELNLRWKSEAGMIENIESVVEEYRNTRQLLPIRICLLGPPAVGKTTVARKLCSHYQIHHVTIKDIIEERFAELEEIVAETDPENFGEEVAAAKRTLENLNKSMRMNDGRLADHLVFEILQEKLNSKPCRNQGFVLEGFPKTYEQARQIFSDGDMDDDDYALKKPVCNRNITPEHVFALDATDDFLNKRAQGLPEKVAEKMRCTEEEFVPRLTKYRNYMAAEETVLDYFDELEIHPKHIEVTVADPKYTAVAKEIIEIVGVPKNYGLSEEEQRELDRRKQEERRLKLSAEAAERKRRNEATLAVMATQYAAWENLSELNRQETELLEARALPLRNYLMKYVMPSLTDAILDCCKIKVEDPVDFLAEHLLRNNQRE